MYVCMYVCMYVRTYVRMYVYIHILLRVCKNMYSYIRLIILQYTTNTGILVVPYNLPQVANI